MRKRSTTFELRGFSMAKTKLIASWESETNKLKKLIPHYPNLFEQFIDKHKGEHICLFLSDESTLDVILIDMHDNKLLAVECYSNAHRKPNWLLVRTAEIFGVGIEKHE